MTQSRLLHALPIRLAPVLLLLAACSPSSETTPSATAGAGAAAYNTTLDMAELMRYVVEPAADVLWDNAGWINDAEGYRELYPTTEEAWDQLIAYAATVAEAGNLLLLPGRAVDNDAWAVYSEGMAAAGLTAMESLKARDNEAFFQAGAELYSVCRACHQAYNPDIVSRFVDSEPQ